jgi:predicted  nucleic acid-binding Zn-ribbon protein
VYYRGEHIMKIGINNVTGDIMNSKEKYVEKRVAEIDKWTDELQGLEAKITAAGKDVKAKLEHKDHVQSLRQKCDDAKKKLSEIESADNETWEDLKGGVESIWMSISDGFQKVKAKF